ncbi:VOC family protein [Marinivivus vitaminiproducens]|uniref:VOC family protein n=1 Tax=Marinivivus vitaminiproducens TaxID=3035935 RepID=UPI0027AB3277|nr:VOC family protein [Geminicoccaceae bacterium SCSIO 64248]
MDQRLSLITLSVTDLARSRRFYVDGLGWSPHFENEQIVFFQLNGLAFGLFELAAYMADAKLAAKPGYGGIALAYNARERDQVEPLIAHAVDAGGTLLKAAAEPPWGGYSGYFADPDGHVWEIAWNPGWTIDGAGHVTIGG